MERIAQFEKVSFEQFKEDIISLYGDTAWGDLENGILTDDDIRVMYDAVSIPERATARSAGYDFVAPFSAFLRIGDSMVFPTGLRVSMDDGWCLKIYPRSGLGFKHGVGLSNTVGIIDGDYYDSANEGHMFIKLANHGNHKVNIQAGDKIAQGIFVPFGITEDDHADGVRNGGFGSTGR